MDKDWETETHPSWYRDLPSLRTLILGSFPPHPSKHNYPFYYPNGLNRFWKILADIAGMPLEWTKKDPTKAVEYPTDQPTKVPVIYASFAEAVVRYCW